MKMDLYPEKAQYLTGEEVLLIAEKTDVMPSDGQPAGMNELLELRIFSWKADKDSSSTDVR